MEFESIPIKPLGRKEINQLETALLFGTLFRKEVLNLIKNPKDRLTWVDSLAVAAKALARRQAGLSVSEIAEEVGRSEQTIRKHLNQETEAGKLVYETFEAIKRGELHELVKFLDELEELEKGEKEIVEASEVENLKKENEELRKKVKELEDKVEEVRELLEEAIDRIEL